MSRVLKCPELTCSRRESHIYTRSLYSHRQMMARDAEEMEGERASDGRALLWVVLWQCLSWLLCGVRTKQSASILPQKLVTLGGPSIRPRSRTQLPTRTLSQERDKKSERQSVHITRLLFPFILLIVSVSFCFCHCRLNMYSDWFLKRFKWKTDSCLQYLWSLFPWRYCHSLD